MKKTETLKLSMRSRQLVRDDGGHAVWQVVTIPQVMPECETAILICDMWDNHWSRGAAERVDAMAPRMNDVVKAARDRGVLIVHAPSDTMDFYAGTPSRTRVQSVPQVEPPALLDHVDPPLPVDASDGGSDTGEKPWYKAWSREHPALEVDEDRDIVSEDGKEVYSFLRYQGINHLLIMGVHTNMCVLRRSFAIKAMVRWGIDVCLVRDLTDALYNPAMRPYVSHDEGTRLVIEFIEAFWCPTVASEELLGDGEAAHPR